MRTLLFLFSIAIFLTSCWDLQTGEPIQGVAPGTWKGIFKLEDQAVPILYEIRAPNKEQPIELIFKTAKKELKADHVKIWGDTLFADFNATNTQLKIIYQIDQMDGFLYDLSEVEYPIAFAGIHGIRQRFPDVRKKPTADLTGEWKLSAIAGPDSTIQGKLRITTKENYAEASLQLTTHTSPIQLEGTVQGNKLYLSGFDGKTISWLSANIKDPKFLDQGNLKLNNQSFFWEAYSNAGVVHQ